MGIISECVPHIGSDQGGRAILQRPARAHNEITYDSEEDTRNEFLTGRRETTDKPEAYKGVSRFLPGVFTYVPELLSGEVNMPCKASRSKMRTPRAVIVDHGRGAYRRLLAAVLLDSQGDSAKKSFSTP